MKIKTTLSLGVLICLGGLAVSPASANLIVNGDFELGNNFFTSQYGYTDVAGGLATGGEGSGAGLYAIGTDPTFYHPSFATFGDHTTGTGNMMIVNGSQVAGKNVWTGSLVSSLTAGATYELSAWVRNVYPDSPALLDFSVGGVQVGSDFSVTGTDAWHEFTATFVATASQTPAAVDVNLAFTGNDFALDDISLVAVPEPATVLAGVLLLLPFGASAFRIIRNRKTGAV